MYREENRSMLGEVAMPVVYYYPGVDADLLNQWAEDQRFHHAPYHLLTNSCKTWAVRGIFNAIWEAMEIH